MGESSDEPGREIGVVCLHGNGFHERTVVCFHGSQLSKPKIFMMLPERKPSAELISAYQVFITDLFSREMMAEMISQNTEDKEETVLGVRNNDIRQDGMGVSAAAASDTHDGHFFPDNRVIPVFSDISFVISKDSAVAAGTAAGTGFQFRAVLVHKRDERLF